VIRPRWRKVWRDLWDNKTRTILVVLSIAIGVFAIGTIVSTHFILNEDLSASYEATNPANIILFLLDDVEPEFIQSIREIEGVEEAEGRRSTGVRLQVGEEWRTLRLFAVEDFDDISLEKFTPVSGEWPPPERTMLVERSSLFLVEAEVADSVLVRTTRDQGIQREIQISGLVHDLHRYPARLGREPYGYVTLDTLQWLGFSRGFDEIHIKTDGDPHDIDHIFTVAHLAESKVERSGILLDRFFIPDPGEVPTFEIWQTILLVLSIVGALSLLASSLLVINIVNSLVTQQTRQIGVMKAIGARTDQIAGMYLLVAIIFGLLSLVIAIPLGALAAYIFSNFLADLLNFDLVGFRIPVLTLLIEIGVGILVPFVAAFYPVIRGARVTVHEAIHEYGIRQDQFGSSVLDRAMAAITGKVLAFSRPVRLALRNIIRRKVRLTLTLFAFLFGSTIFVSVLSVRTSVMSALDQAVDYYNYDVTLNLARAYSIDEVKRVAQEVPGVSRVDSLVYYHTFRVGIPGSEAGHDRDHGAGGEDLQLIALDPETDFIQPVLLEGRWLLPEDSNAVVVNTTALSEEPDLHIGDIVRLQLEDKQLDFEIVGIVSAIGPESFIYANRPYITRELGAEERVSAVQVIGERRDPEFQANLAGQLETYFVSSGLNVANAQVTAEEVEAIVSQFNLVITFLVILSILVAIVGGLGLTGTMSINVLERTREIGVMRAIGAANNSILRVIMVEGIFVAAVSWVLGALLAFPIGKLLSDAVGNTLVNSPLPYSYSFVGAVSWLLIVFLIAIIASILPTSNAIQLSVERALAYE
jgi:putative ABC transport system permease protein